MLQVIYMYDMSVGSVKECDLLPSIHFTFLQNSGSFKSFWFNLVLLFQELLSVMAEILMSWMD